MAVSETVLFYLVSIFISFFGVSYWYFKNTYSYWSKKNVKSMPVVPIFGTYGHMLFQNRHIAYVERDAYYKYPNEKFVGCYKGMNPELLVRDPELIKMMMVKDFAHFHDRQGYHNSNNSIILQNLFTVKGTTWNVMRRKLTPTFTSSKMKLMFPLIVESTEVLQNFLIKTIAENDIQEIREILAKFTTETIGSCAFGMKMDTMTPEEALFRKIGKMIFSATKWRSFDLFIRHILPKISRLLDIRPVNDKTLDNFFLGLVQKIMKDRKTPSSRHDFMDLMIDLKAQEKVNVDKNNKFHQNNGEEEHLEITDELIAAQAFIFFAGGFETSSTTMSYAFRELALNPDVQEKLYNEIKTTLDKHGKLTYDAVQEMQYLEAVIDETLRKYPPVTHLERLCTSEYKIPDTDVVLDKGVEIIFPVFSLHYDEKYYPEPEKFIPDRFLPDTEKTFHPFSYLPFGEGPRNCIGSRFGKLQTAAGIIAIASKYKVEKCDKTVLVPTLAPVSFISTLEEGVWLRMKPRL